MVTLEHSTSNIWNPSTSDVGFSPKKKVSFGKDIISGNRTAHNPKKMGLPKLQKLAMVKKARAWFKGGSATITAPTFSNPLYEADEVAAAMKAQGSTDVEITGAMGMDAEKRKVVEDEATRLERQRNIKVGGAAAGALLLIVIIAAAAGGGGGGGGGGGAGSNGFGGKASTVSRASQNGKSS
jgi:hypothetical protein